jgi:malonyl-CoA/methylmalonyl-CoA synthetase
MVRSQKAALDGRFAKFKLPKRVAFVEHLPRNTTGKVLKSVLRERFADLYTTTAQVS